MPDHSPLIRHGTFIYVQNVMKAISRNMISPSSNRQRNRTPFINNSQSVSSSASTVTQEQYDQLKDKVEQVSMASANQFSAINSKVSQILNSINMLSATNQPGSAVGASSENAGETGSRSSGNEQ